jgi:hypothetical protein
MVSPIWAGSADVLPAGGGPACLLIGSLVRGYWQFAPTPGDGTNGGRCGPLTGATRGSVDDAPAAVLAEVVVAVVFWLWRVQDAVVMATATMASAAATRRSFIISPAAPT